MRENKIMFTGDLPLPSWLFTHNLPLSDYFSKRLETSFWFDEEDDDQYSDRLLIKD